MINSKEIFILPGAFHGLYSFMNYSLAKYKRLYFAKTG